jgi:hypothetical protein
MKIWNSYGSEHSMNLVMIGRFKEAGSAEEAKKFIEKLTAQVVSEPAMDTERIELDRDRTRFSDAVMDLFKEWSMYSLSPLDLEELRYEANVERKDQEVVITTEETEVGVFLKILVGKGARVEVYSAHDYPDTGHGRQRSGT